MLKVTLRRQRRNQRRHFARFFRSLRIEPLEQRALLAILTVNSLADGPVNLTDGTVTLRDAIRAANNDLQVSPGGPTGSGADEIQFQSGLSGAITLNQGQLGLTSDLRITGPGPTVLTVSGNGATRIFNVDNSLVSVKTVAISGLTITDGAAANASGGGIFNRENLTLQNSSISGNVAGDGGGIANSGGTLMVQSSTISGNSAILGGGISSPSISGMLTVQNCTISGNSASGSGGGGGIYGGALTVQNSTISGNAAVFDGGGIANVGTLTIQNSTISGNSADSAGGILSGTLISNSLTLLNSTVSGNRATTLGGGIASRGTTTVRNSTITQNHSNNDDSGTEAGGGILNGLGSCHPAQHHRGRQFSRQRHDYRGRHQRQSERRRAPTI